jgi:branched-subunit amino acid aminotransferase/4-amino-4-deoxychorismate lyase
VEGQVYIDGQYYDAENAQISVSDRGLLIGDGVFEDVRVYGGKPFNIDGQLQRLVRHAASAQLSMPLGHESLVGVVHELLCRNHTADGGIRHIVFVVQAENFLIQNMNGSNLEDTFLDVIVGLARGIGLQVREARISVGDLQKSDEYFLSGFVTEIVPVTAVNGHMIQAGSLGKIANLLSAHLERLIRELSNGDAVPGDE